MLSKILLATVAVTALAGAARATTYDYSYTFASGDVLAGSFDGTANGNLITDLSKISASVDGFAFNGSGSLLGGHFDSTSYRWIADASVASFDGKQNNFLFADAADFQPDFNFSNMFFDVNSFNNAYLHSTTTYAGDNGDGSWQVSAVPEPASMALLGASIFGLVLIRRRSHAVSLQKKRRAPPS